MGWLAILAAPGLWGLYLMYCALHASMKSGKFYTTPWPVRALSYVLLAVMVTADVLFNFTLGSLFFLELPDIHRPTFTQRCSSHMAEDGWRGEIARWVCFGWLNPFEANHCR
ncbi:MAG TPA: hypothetical protein VFA81_06555 [Burkholderiales bacterium]|nr:hypothetical protein [Burkholderiales bacterium]